MGSKRPIEDVEFNESPPKHPKQFNFENDLNSFSQDFPDFEEIKETDKSGDDDDSYIKIEYDDDYDTSNDDTGSSPAYISPFSPEFVDYHFPRRFVPQFRDTYSHLLESPPRKQVPIGPDYQAEVPMWDPQALFNDFDEKLLGDCVHYPKLLGDCVNDQKLLDGHGKKGCTCPDKGSIRCVQEHVKEAREALKLILGNEKFVKLGFCDMGEDVCEKWSKDEERVFHEVVYTKSVSNDKNFWENLSAVFPSRKKSEIVSYYFNVFILRRRSVQNRSKDLDIDSDDDDWDESYWCPLGMEQKNEVENNDGKNDSKVGLYENNGGSNNGWEPGFLSCKNKAWDDFFPMSPLKFCDLPPSGNMMDDIFGPCPKNNGPFL